MKKIIKEWIIKWLSDTTNEYNPKFNRELKAVSFESKQPLAGKKYLNYLFQCTEWTNGEGYDLTINVYNDVSKTETNKILSLHTDEINGILSCLNYFNYFNFD